jgi:hypothetical protein
VAKVANHSMMFSTLPFSTISKAIICVTMFVKINLNEMSAMAESKGESFESPKSFIFEQKVYRLILRKFKAEEVEDE